MQESLEKDIAVIGRISAVPTILRTMRASTGLRFTLVSRVTSERWVACAVHDEIEFGLKVGGELDVATTLCSEVRDSYKPILIEHASTEPEFRDHPTPKMYGFESYVAVPIFRRNGQYFGNLCGLDPLPRKLRDGKTLSMLELFCELISVELEAQEQLTQSREELGAQRELAQLREQFIAVLGHDVRNPLSSISTVTDIMLLRSKNPEDLRWLKQIRSSCDRIAALVDDVLDLAKARMGGGIGVTMAETETEDLLKRLRHIVTEVQSSHATRVIQLERVGTSVPVRCDARRIEQVFSNLLSNAVEHGAPGTPICVSIGGDARTFTLTVTNQGTSIPAENLPHLFEPYFRGGSSARESGLGLGLFIVSEIAKAHGGKVEVSSSPEVTSFTFTMARNPALPLIGGG